MRRDVGNNERAKGLFDTIDYCQTVYNKAAIQGSKPWPVREKQAKGKHDNRRNVSWIPPFPSLLKPIVFIAPQKNQNAEQGKGRECQLNPPQGYSLNLS